MMSLFFADDTNLFHSRSDIHMIKQKITVDIMQIPQWLEINKLSLKVKRANFIAFMNQNVSRPDICFQLMDMILNFLNQILYG